MIGIPDPIAWLRDERFVPFDDVDPDAVLDPAQSVEAERNVREQDPTAARVFARALAGDRPSFAPSRRRRRRWFAAGGIGAIALVSGGVVVSGVINREKPRIVDEVACVATADIASGKIGGVAVVDDDPVATCRAMWEAGLLPDLERNLGPGQVAPPLVACTHSEGAVWVFPGDEGTCAAVGLPVADI